MTTRSITEWQQLAYETAKAKGWHQSEPDIWKMLGNIHGEVSEAWEEARKPDFEPTRIYHSEGGKLEGLPIELADILIRVFDTAEALGIALEDAVVQKNAYNQTRSYRHGNKRA